MREAPRALASSTDSSSIRGTVLAFDYGERRIGVAVGSTAVGIAHPLEVIEQGAGVSGWERIAALYTEWKPVCAVVGLPVRDDDRKHELHEAVHAFALELMRRFGVPVRFVDERFTSSEAALQLRDAGIHGRQQKQHLDQLAATSILQDYLDRERTRA
jgi:putative Holliday junction resolvase